MEYRSIGFVEKAIKGNCPICGAKDGEECKIPDFIPEELKKLIEFPIVHQKRLDRSG